MDEKEYQSLRKKVKSALAALEPRVTKTQLAQQLGVSPTTLSMALNGIRTTERYVRLVEEAAMLLL